MRGRQGKARRHTPQSFPVSVPHSHNDETKFLLLYVCMCENAARSEKEREGRHTRSRVVGCLLTHAARKLKKEHITSLGWHAIWTLWHISSSNIIRRRKASGVTQMESHNMYQTQKSDFGRSRRSRSSTTSTTHAREAPSVAAAAALQNRISSSWCIRTGGSGARARTSSR